MPDDSTILFEVKASVAQLADTGAKLLDGGNTVVIACTHAVFSSMTQGPYGNDHIFLVHKGFPWPG